MFFQIDVVGNELYFQARVSDIKIKGSFTAFVRDTNKALLGPKWPAARCEIRMQRKYSWANRDSPIQPGAHWSGPKLGTVPWNIWTSSARITAGLASVRVPCLLTVKSFLWLRGSESARSPFFCWWTQTRRACALWHDVPGSPTEIAGFTPRNTLWCDLWRFSAYATDSPAVPVEC